MKEELRRFRADGPGRRFLNHHERARERRTWWKVALRVGTGTLSIVWGIALWVLPGPGWLFVIFGLALLAGVSRRISRFMDAAEVRVRVPLGKVKRFWKGSSVAVKAAIIVVTIAAAAALAFWAWRIWDSW